MRLPLKKLLLERIRQVLPKNEKEADDFVEDEKLDDVKKNCY